MSLLEDLDTVDAMRQTCAYWRLSINPGGATEANDYEYAALARIRAALEAQAHLEEGARLCALGQKHMSELTHEQIALYLRDLDKWLAAEAERKKGRSDE